MKRAIWIRRMLAVAAVVACLDMIALEFKSREFTRTIVRVETSVQVEQRLRTLETLDLSGETISTTNLKALDRDLRETFNPDENDTEAEARREIRRLWSKVYTATLRSAQQDSPTTASSIESDFQALMRAIEALRLQQINTVLQRQSNTTYRLALALAALSLVTCIVAYVLLSRWLGELQQVVTHSHSKIDSLSGSIMGQRQVVSEQATSIAQVTQMLEQLNSTSHASSEQASIAASRAKEIAELTGRGVDLVNRTQAAIAGIETQTNTISERIWQLRTWATEVGQIALLVEELAIRTNTLSLNAAIEAVRASQAGLGFHVIAKEIRELSLQSQQAAQRIGTMSDDIERAIEQTVQVTQSGLAQVKSGSQVVADTTETFHQIQTAIEEVNDTSHRIAFNAYELLWPVQQLTDALELLNQTAKSTQTHSNRVASGLSELELSFDRIQSGIGDRLRQRLGIERSSKTTSAPSQTS